MVYKMKYMCSQRLNRVLHESTARYLGFYPKTQTVPQESNPQQLSFEWSHFRI